MVKPGFHYVWRADPDFTTYGGLVARNKALIVFPASIRWARRADRLFPGFSNKILLRQMRELRRYRTADERVPG